MSNKKLNIESFKNRLLKKSLILLEMSIDDTLKTGKSREIYLGYYGEKIRRTIRRAGQTVAAFNLIPGPARA